MNKFWLGWSVCVCWYCFMQDFFGREKYINLLNQYWMNTPYWIWPLIAVLLIGVNWFLETDENRKKIIKIKKIHTAMEIYIPDCEVIVGCATEDISMGDMMAYDPANGNIKKYSSESNHALRFS